jgi:hypothetical protein
MQDKGFKTPILFIVFNRPDCTQQVFKKIRSIRPKKLFVAADGPRMDKIGEQERCEEVRKIVTKIDWDCEVKNLFRESNLGCKIAVSSAINWFFENVKQGIILEDDCLPNLSFFQFCHEMLDRYKDDNRVMHVSGSNFHKGWCRDSDYSYYFGNYGSIWGWATWKRAWNYYDINMKIYQEIQSKEYLNDVCTSKEDVNFRKQHFDMVFLENFDTWDHQWTFSKLTNYGLSINPIVNLVTNIGFGDVATHTFDKNNDKLVNPTINLQFPLKHPPFMIRDFMSDKKRTEIFLYRDPQNILKRVLNRLRSLLK